MFTYIDNLDHLLEEYLVGRFYLVLPHLLLLGVMRLWPRLLVLLRSASNQALGGLDVPQLLLWFQAPRASVALAHLLLVEHLPVLMLDSVQHSLRCVQKTLDLSVRGVGLVAKHIQSWSFLGVRGRRLACLERLITKWPPVERSKSLKAISLVGLGKHQVV